MRGRRLTHKGNFLKNNHANVNFTRCFQSVKRYINQANQELLFPFNSMNKTGNPETTQTPGTTLAGINLRALMRLVKGHFIIKQERFEKKTKQTN